MMKEMIGMRNKNSRFVKKFGIFSQYILPTSVILAIGVSLAFTWLIWTNPAHFTKNTNESLTAGTTQLSARSLTDIYAPTQVIYADSKQNQTLLFDQKINLVNEIVKMMQKWKFTKVHESKKISAKAYGEVLNQPNALTLSYPDAVAAQFVNDTFNQQLNITSPNEFNRIIVPLNGNVDKLYLLDDASFSIYEISLKDASVNGLLTLIKRAQAGIPVNEIMYHQNVLLMYAHSVTLKQYSYLLNKQSQHLFLTALFNNGTSNDVKTRKTNETTTYEEGNNRRVVFNNQNGAVDYQSFNGTKGSNTFNNLLRQGFNDLLTLGVPLDNTRYFESNPQGNNFVYRTYVEGFPIFNQTRYGTIKLSYDNPGNKQATFSQYSLQVPLPNNQPDITLPSSQDVVKQLDTAGIKISDIQNMQIGYQWEASTASDMVVNLRPVWYIEVNDKWQLLSQWLQKS